MQLRVRAEQFRIYGLWQYIFYGGPLRDPVQRALRIGTDRENVAAPYCGAVERPGNVNDERAVELSQAQATKRRWRGFRSHPMLCAVHSPACAAKGDNLGRKDAGLTYTVRNAPTPDGNHVCAMRL